MIDPVPIASVAEWRAWLAANHGRPDGVFVVTWKKASGGPHVPYAALVEEALCFGWVDNRGGKVDDERSMLLFAPRKPKSGWSAINKERVKRLVADGRMHAAGLAKIKVAKLNGAWSSLDEVEAMTIPDDLAALFRKNRPAAANFAAFPRSAKKAILQWIAAAKRPETRAGRITETVTLAARNVRANQSRQ